MLIVYMLPYYIEVFYNVSIGKIMKCGMCWCVLLSYFVVSGAAVLYCTVLYCTPVLMPWPLVRTA